MSCEFFFSVFPLSENRQSLYGNICGVEVKPSERVLHAVFWYRELCRLQFCFEDQAC